MGIPAGGVYAGRMEIQGLPGRVLDELGPAIASGEIPEGAVLRGEELEQRFGVSRTVVREAARYHWALPVLWAAVIALMVLNRFWYYWSTLL